MESHAQERNSRPGNGHRRRLEATNRGRAGIRRDESTRRSSRTRGGVFHSASTRDIVRSSSRDRRRDYRRVTVPKGEVESTDGVYHPHGYARITIGPDGTVAPLEIALRKGATIAAQAVDSEGKPLSEVWVSGESLFVQSSYPGAGSGRCIDGLFRAASFEPGQACRVFFMHNERHLAGFADLTAKPDPTEPVGVTLRGTARVRGKLLKPDGTPDRNKGVFAYFPLSPDEVKVTPMDFLRGDRVMSYGTATRSGGFNLTKTNEDGEFEIGDLLAGVRNYVAFWPLTSNEIRYIPVDGLEPGEARDLASVRPIVLTEQ